MFEWGREKCNHFLAMVSDAMQMAFARTGINPSHFTSRLKSEELWSSHTGFTGADWRRDRTGLSACLRGFAGFAWPALNRKR